MYLFILSKNVCSLKEKPSDFEGRHLLPWELTGASTLSVHTEHPHWAVQVLLLSLEPISPCSPWSFVQDWEVFTAALTSRIKHKDPFVRNYFPLLRFSALRQSLKSVFSSCRALWPLSCHLVWSVIRLWILLFRLSVTCAITVSIFKAYIEHLLMRPRLLLYLTYPLRSGPSPCQVKCSRTFSLSFILLGHLLPCPILFFF